MSNKFDDIDYCLSLLFDYAYNPNKSDCLKLEYPSKKDVLIKNLKKGDNFNFKKVLSGTKFHFLFESDERLHFIRDASDTYKTFVKVGKYKNTPDSIHNGELIDMKISYLLGEPATNSVNKFLLLPVFNFDVEISQLDGIDKVLLDKIKEYFGDKGTVYFQIYENYDDTQRLDQYIKNNKPDSETVKNIIFQVLYALFKIQLAYPSFRHNKLDTSSIYLAKRREMSRISRVQVREKVINVPASTFTVKLTDFYKSNIKGYADNRDAGDLKRENPFYDVHYFLTSLYKTLEENDIKDSKFIHFYNSVIPSKFATHNNKTIGLDEAYYLNERVSMVDPYLIITKNNFFTELINENTISDMASPVSNTPENLSSYGYEDESLDYPSLSDSGELPVVIAKKQVKKQNSKKNNKRVSGSRKIYESAHSEKRRSEKKVKDDESEISETSEYGESIMNNQVSETSYSSEGGAFSLQQSAMSQRSHQSQKPKNDIFASVESLGRSQRGDTEPSAHSVLSNYTASQNAGRKHRKRSGHRRSDSFQSNIPQSIANDIPDGYEGMLPNWLQSKLGAPPTPGMQQGMMPGMQQGMMPGMQQGMMPGAMAQPFDMSNAQIDNSVFLPSSGMHQGMMSGMTDGYGSMGLPSEFGPMSTEARMMPSMGNNSIGYGSMGLPSEFGPMSTEAGSARNPFANFPQNFSTGSTAMSANPAMANPLAAPSAPAGNPFADILGQAGGANNDYIESDTEVMNKFFF